ncbi:MAG: (Fe-S)-binding protein [Bacteroidetes bacterium]|nr:(Fe-S)-binding protein [Bacteroidota bacterium]
MKMIEKRAFAPGCALMLYKPLLAKRVHKTVNELLGEMELYSVCCRHEPGPQELTEIINICPGCDKRFRNNYPNTTSISLWEILAESGDFKFPDYHGRRMAIHDACPTRDQDRVHNAIRSLLKKMNITVTESKKTRTKSVCCGDSFYGLIPLEDMKELMRKRAQEMPEEEVVVYCVSCVNSMLIGGRKPRYLVDLLFGEDTTPTLVEPGEYHEALDKIIGT